MPIKEDFCHNKKPIGKIMHSDGEHFHWVWPSQGLAEASKNPDVLAAYKKNGEKMEKIGVSGTMVAVDWDSCVADEGHDDSVNADPSREHGCIWCMACVSVCPPQAVLVDQGNQEWHEKALGTYQKLGSGQA